MNLFFLYGFFVNVTDVWKWLTCPSNTTLKKLLYSILMYGSDVRVMLTLGSMTRTAPHCVSETWQASQLDFNLSCKNKVTSASFLRQKIHSPSWFPSLFLSSLEHSYFTSNKNTISHRLSPESFDFFPGWLCHFQGPFITIWREIHRSKIPPRWRHENWPIGDWGF